MGGEGDRREEAEKVATANESRGLARRSNGDGCSAPQRTAMELAYRELMVLLEDWGRRWGSMRCDTAHSTLFGPADDVEMPENELLCCRQGRRATGQCRGRLFGAERR